MGTILVIFGSTWTYLAVRISAHQQKYAAAPAALRRRMSPGRNRLGAVGLVVLGLGMLVAALRGLF